MTKKLAIRVSTKDGKVIVDYGDGSEQTFATMSEAMRAAYEVARREKRIVRQT